MRRILLLAWAEVARVLGTGLCVAMARVASTSLAGRRRLWDCLAERRRLFAKVTARALLRSLAERRQLGFCCAAGRRTFQRLAGRRHLFARAWVSLARRRRLTMLATRLARAVADRRTACAVADSSTR